MNKNLIEANGRVKSDKRQPMLLEQVWGQADNSKYGTLDESKYTQKVNDMTRADLESHARMMGVIVVEESLRLRDNLIGAFRNYVALIDRPEPPTVPGEISAAAKKVLSEGR